MGLYKYYIDCNELSSDDFLRLEKSIEQFSYNGFHYNRVTKEGMFLLENKDFLQLINVPECCHLRDS